MPPNVFNTCSTIDSKKLNLFDTYDVNYIMMCNRGQESGEITIT